MGGATIWPVPKAIDLEAYMYPRKWRRNLRFYYGSMFLVWFQIHRFLSLHKQRTMRGGEYMDWGNYYAPKRIII